MDGGWYWGDISVYYVSILLLFLNLFNLSLFIHLTAVSCSIEFLDEEGLWSNILYGYLPLVLQCWPSLAFIHTLLLPLMIVFRHVN